jgi:hypothetical protein
VAQSADALLAHQVGAPPKTPTRPPSSH